MKNTWETTSIRFRINFLLLVFIVVPLLIISFLYTTYSWDALNDEIVSANQHTLEIEQYQVGRSIEAMLSASSLVSQDQQIINALSHFKQYQSYEKSVVADEITQKFTHMKNYILPRKGELTLIHMDGTVFTTASTILAESPDTLLQFDWFKRTVDLNGFVHWFVAPQQLKAMMNQNEDYLSMARLIKYGREADQTAVLLIQIEATSLLNITNQQLSDSRTMILLDQDGTIMSSSGGESIGEPFVFPEEVVSLSDPFTQLQDQRMLQSINIPQLNWQLMLISKQQPLHEKMQLFKEKLFIVILFFFLLFFILIFLLSQTITKPISQLESYIKQIDRGNLQLRAEISGPIEIKSLTHQFNHMVHRLRESLSKNEEERKKKEFARLQALQAQINPHFLFNTLNTIKWSAYMSEAPNVGEMISNLGRMLEISVKHDKDFFTIEEELESLDLYMSLQKLRFQDQFNMYIEIEDSIKPYLIPKLTLQPIVENSLIHGFSNVLSKGEIRIACSAKEHRILIRIEDNGKGMSPSEVEAILDMEHYHTHNHKHRFSGIGLRNVFDRIQLYFGESYGLKIQSELGKGTVVLLEIPMLKKEDQDA